MREIFTIGYQDADHAEFDSLLVEHNIQILVDVRAYAGSRRKGFAKKALTERLRGHGIDYLHLVSLGDPKPGRVAARQGRFIDFRRIYADQLATPDAIAALVYLRQIASAQTVVLMCYETDASHCHRQIIADRLRPKSSLLIKHLRVEPDQRHAVTRASRHIDQSRTAP